MSYQVRQVIVTGGTGALGAAVVGGLIEAGATCYAWSQSVLNIARFPLRRTTRQTDRGSSSPCRRQRRFGFLERRLWPIEKPKLRAFCRRAPALRLIDFAILLTGV